VVMGNSASARTIPLPRPRSPHLVRPSRGPGRGGARKGERPRRASRTRLTSRRRPTRSVRMGMCETAASYRVGGRLRTLRVGVACSYPEPHPASDGERLGANPRTEGVGRGVSGRTSACALSLGRLLPRPGSHVGVLSRGGSVGLGAYWATLGLGRGCGRLPPLSGVNCAPPCSPRWAYRVLPWSTLLSHRKAPGRGTQGR
jgi:hypothetical protein